MIVEMNYHAVGVEAFFDDSKEGWLVLLLIMIHLLITRPQKVPKF
jgi:hypothetical protein